MLLVLLVQCSSQPAKNGICMYVCHVCMPCMYDILIAISNEKCRRLSKNCGDEGSYVYDVKHTIILLNYKTARSLRAAISCKVL